MRFNWGKCKQPGIGFLIIIQVQQLIANGYAAVVSDEEMRLEIHACGKNYIIDASSDDLSSVLDSLTQLDKEIK